MSIFTHHGPWNELSRQPPTLNFIEKYFNLIDSLDLTSVPSSTFFAPFATFQDTKGDVHTSGPRIWDGIRRLFFPFSKVYHEVIEVRVVPDGSGKGKDVVYAQFLTHFRLKGDEEEIVAPRFFVFVVGEREGEGGTDGLWLEDMRLFWDTGILGRYVTERKRRASLR